MRTNLRLAAALGLALAFGAASARADDYVADPDHTSVIFKISHIGISWTYGRFDEFSGEFSLDSANPAKSSFSMSIKADSIDTNSKKRDEHLRSPDFFNVKQFPTISFKSTSVKPVAGGYEISGDFTMHGATKPITFTLKEVGRAEFPKGTQRVGYATELTLKRSEFGMDKFQNGAVGDEVYVAISFEGVKK